MSQTDSSIDYQTTIADHGSYRFNRVYSLNGQTVTPTSSIVENQWEIPQKVFNLSKSTLDFQMGVPGTTSNYTRLMSLGMSMIDSVSLMSREGVEIMRLQHVDMYTRAILPMLSKLQEYLTYEASLGAITSVIANVTDLGFNFFRAKVAPTATPTILSGNYPQSCSTRIGANTGVAVTSEDDYIEPCYFHQGGVAGAQYINYSLPLSKIAPHTLLSLNKDMYFGQAVIFRVNWTPIAKIGWDTADPANISTTPLNIVSAVTYTGLHMKLAIEQNPVVISTLVNRVNTTGLSLNIPFVHSYLYSSPSAVATTMQQRFNRAHGERLLHVYHFVANTNASNYAHLNADISNLLPTPDGVNNAKINSFMPSLNSSNLSEYVINALKGEDYENMRDLLKGSVITSKNVYDHNRCYVLSWRKGRCVDWLENDDVIDGLELDVEQNIVFDVTCNSTAAAYRNFMYAVTQRRLNIAPGGIISIS